MIVPLFDTPRLRLRAYTLDDRDWFVGTFSDPRVMQAVDGALSEEMAGALFDGMCRGTSTRIFAAWAAEHQGEVIGHGALLREGDDLELGYILSPPAWGRGFATEIARALSDYALFTLGRDRLIATVDDGHRPSVRVLEKIGMTLVKRVDDPEGAYLIYTASGTNPP